MNDLNETVANDFDMWNETDDTKRRLIIENLWTQNAVSVDPIASVTGLSQIDGMVAKVQQDYPAHKFSLVNEIVNHNDRAHFQWEMKNADGEVQLAGRDCIRLEEGRIADLSGFWV